MQKKRNNLEMDRGKAKRSVKENHFCTGWGAGRVDADRFSAAECRSARGRDADGGGVM
jgi:hypothetical protein